MMQFVVKPYTSNPGTKKEQVREMFDNIAPRYDFLNHFLSLGIDKIWIKKTIRVLSLSNPSNILDIATGTGDLAIAAMKLNPERVTGVDLSVNMLEKGKIKIREKGLEHKIELMQGDAENLPFRGESFDAVMVAFGVRNFENLEKGLKEIARVLKPGGTLVILEFSKPRLFPAKQAYWFYSSVMLPFWGKLISGDSSAYTYLPESVKAFPDGKEFLGIMQHAGFEKTMQKILSLGIASIYHGKKNRGIEDTRENTNLAPDSF